MIIMERHLKLCFLMLEKAPANALDVNQVKNFGNCLAAR